MNHTTEARRAMLREGTLKRLHVDKHVIAQNRKRSPEDAQPAITIQTSKGPLKAFEVEVLGPSRFTYQPCTPLSCGARLWIETRAELRIVEGPAAETDDTETAPLDASTVTTTERLI